MTIWQFLDSPEGRRDPWRFLFIGIIVVGMYSICYGFAFAVHEAIKAIKAKIINDYLESEISEGEQK